MARYIAKHLVAAELADTVEVQVAYVIGRDEPTSVMVNTFGTGKVSDTELTELVGKHFSLTPEGIITHLNLRRANLSTNRRIRAFWTERRRFYLGKIDLNLVETLKTGWSAGQRRFPGKKIIIIRENTQKALTKGPFCAILYFAYTIEKGEKE